MNEFEELRKDFTDGVQEIFTTLFNDGVEDGIDLYRISEQTVPDVYGENRFKVYQKPLKLVSKVELSPTQGAQDTEGVKISAVFTVPLSEMQTKGLEVNDAGLSVLRRGIIDYHGTKYLVDNIAPKAFVAGIYLMFSFQCTELLDIQEILIEPEPEPPQEEGGVSDADTPNDRGLEQGGTSP